MGFRIPERTARLVFDGDYQGLEVVVRLNIPLGVFLHIQDLITKGETGETLKAFADVALLAWNMEDDGGQPIPAHAEGILRVDMDMATRIITEWHKVMVNPPDPLAVKSADGTM